MITTRRLKDEAELTAAAAQLVTHEILKPQLPGERVAMMLSGGSTPLAAYRAVAANGVTGGPGQLFFLSDDRRVPFESDKNNFTQIQPLFTAVGCPPQRCLRVQTALNAPEAAEAYHAALDGWIRAGTRFPVGLLGLGADGHTASLFSAADEARGVGKWATWVNRPDGMEGVSVTPEFLLRVERLVFLVSGAGKREMARRLLAEPGSIPAGRVTAAHPRVELWMDEAAAGG
jgi:6-phosphogluconolactonase